MLVLVINSGSSSIKYQVREVSTSEENTDPYTSSMPAINERITLERATLGVEGDQVLAKGLIENIGEPGGAKDHTEALERMSEEIDAALDGREIDAVGHRVVHGGEKFAATTLIDADVKAEIKRLFALAPLHNPANYLGIEVCEQLFPQARQVAVFDTAFHQTLPEYAFRYALPAALYHEHGIRVYGFHGTSHQYVAGQAAAYLQNPAARIITVHLGNGCSMAAVQAGRCLDTSMGFGPLSGLVMGTRSGDIDPSVIFYLTTQLGYSVDEVSALLNKQSGMLGLSGHADMRDVGAAVAADDREATLALELYAYRIRKYLGAYAAVLGGLDAVVFTAGVGENDVAVRRLACQGLTFLGVQIDDERNAVRSRELREISPEGAAVKVMVVPTNEELEIARQCVALLA